MKKHDNKMEIVAITMPPEVVKAGKQEAAKQDMSFSGWVRHLAKKALGLVKE